MKYSQKEKPRSQKTPFPCKASFCKLQGYNFSCAFYHLCPILCQYTVHSDKKKSLYCHSQACNGVSQGLLLWCGGGRYRLESATNEEWNLSPHTLAKWTITQGHAERDFFKKEWFLPFPVPPKFLKKGYGHVPSKEEYMDYRAEVEKTIFLQTQENPPTHLTVGITYWLTQGRCKRCESNR